MTRGVLLVTGSRSLARSDSARRWALGLIRGALVALEDRVDRPVLLHGGCPNSPDAWADEQAALMPITRVAYPLSGWITRDGVSIDRAWTDMKHFGDRRWPLMRNEALVRDAAKAMARGDHVTCLALGSAWATTHGTEYTAAAAESAGIPTTRLVCPRELGP